MRNKKQMAFAVLTMSVPWLAAFGDDSSTLKPVFIAGHGPSTVLPTGNELNPLTGSNKATVPATTTTAPPMTFHGGKVLTSTSVRVVLAGPKWATTTFAGDKIKGLDTFFAGYSNSPYVKTAAEYSGSNGKVGAVVKYQGHSSPSTASVSVDGRNVMQAATVACNDLRSSAFTPDTTGNQLTVVYTDMPRPSTAGYCGYHTAFSCGGVSMQMAFLWNLDGDASCSSQDATTGHSQGLAALTNVTAHEVQETVSDPQLNAWYDSTGAENGDKCAWAFAHTAVTFPNATKWKLQTEWSNTAYALKTGYKTLAGAPGCVDGS
jgi:hypothetical protein